LDADVEKISRRESERSRQQHRGELLDPGVVLLDRIVEEAPRGGDLVLDVGELALQLLKILARLEVRVGLAQGEQLPQRPAQRVLGGGLRRDAPDCAATAALRACTTASSVPRSCPA